MYRLMVFKYFYEYCVEKELEGSGRDMFRGTFWHLPGKSEVGNCYLSKTSFRRDRNSVGTPARHSRLQFSFYMNLPCNAVLCMIHRLE